MMENDYLASVKKQFAYYKMLGDKTIDQLPDDKLFWQYKNKGHCHGRHHQQIHQEPYAKMVGPLHRKHIQRDVVTGGFEHAP